MNETQAMPSPGTYFATNNGNGSIADGLALASLKDGALDGVSCNGISSLRMQVSDVKADIRETIQNQSIRQVTENLNLHNRLCESEKAAIKAEYEGKLETRDAVFKLSEKIDSEHERTNDKLDSFRTDVEHHFCSLERRIDEKFCNLEKRELESTICTLKGQLAIAQSDAQSQSIISKILDGLSKK